MHRILIKGTDLSQANIALVNGNASFIEGYLVSDPDPVMEEAMEFAYSEAGRAVNVLGMLERVAAVAFRMGMNAAPLLSQDLQQTLPEGAITAGMMEEALNGRR